MSHIEQTLNFAAQLRDEVCDMLRISPDKYCELFLESGLQYLASKYTDEFAQVLRSHRLFWAWWKVEYTIKDREFLRRVRLNIPRRTQDYYLQIHVNMDCTPGKNITNTIIKEKKHESRTKDETLRIVDEQ